MDRRRSIEEWIRDEFSFLFRVAKRNKRAIKFWCIWSIRLEFDLLIAVHGGYKAREVSPEFLISFMQLRSAIAAPRIGYLSFI